MLLVNYVYVGRLAGLVPCELMVLTFASAEIKIRLVFTTFPDLPRKYSPPLGKNTQIAVERAAGSFIVTRTPKRSSLRIRDRFT